MTDLPLTEDQCDRLVLKVMEKLAAHRCDQYGAIKPSDLNPDITEHHSLRRGIVQAAYLLGALEMQASEREVLNDLMGWAYSKLHRQNYVKQDDALMLDRMKLLLEHGVDA